MKEPIKETTVKETTVKATPQTRDKLKDLAKKEGRSMTKQLEHIINKITNERQ